MFNSEIYDGTHFGIPSAIQSAKSIGGIQDVKIKVIGDGKAVLRNIDFDKTKMYFTEFQTDKGVTYGKIQNAGQTAVVAVYTPDGEMTNVKIYKNINGYSDFSINNGNNDYIFKIFGFENFENIIPVDKSIIYAKQKESK